jgi:hypothetical protein
LPTFYKTWGWLLAIAPRPDLRDAVIVWAFLRIICGEKSRYSPHNLLRMARYLYQHPDWPNFVWDNGALLPLLGQVRHLQGKIMGGMEALGFDLKSEAMLETITLDVVKSTEIEGEFLDPEQVRSSIARRLGPH